MPPPPKPLHLTTAASLHQTLTSFLVVAFHTILYERGLYPPSTFLLTRAYNFPVRQNRHPKVCRWILDAVAAIQAEMVKSTVSRIVFVIYSEQGEVMERFVFDVERFPVVPEKERLTEFVREGGEGEDRLKGTGVSAVDVEEQLRAAVRKLAYCGGKLGELPEGCTYTVVVELKDGVEPPIGHPQPWIPSEPSLQTGKKGDSERIGSDLGGVKTVPVRAVEAGEFILESWIEEGKSKIDYDT
ncbi:DNA polymerase zeta processivity subunit [Hyphodiscus hymeniophilus]|uniref:DNA polymerase zeta processivity subunit n=1 Tax=Hyphodiscus hymeniophilus TaxID=353542 RepID=A0A9P6VSR5_9HELO|nr:DNA polymerase zeta processivity subunit [Hyphodiscus hymeniophilus]